MTKLNRAPSSTCVHHSTSSSSHVAHHGSPRLKTGVVICSQIGHILESTLSTCSSTLNMGKAGAITGAQCTIVDIPRSCRWPRSFRRGIRRLDHRTDGSGESAPLVPRPPAARDSQLGSALQEDTDQDTLTITILNYLVQHEIT